MKKLLVVIIFLMFISTNAFAEQQIVAGTIRNTGNGYFVVSDKVHVPIGISRVTTYPWYIVVHFDFRAKNIHSFIVSVDEAYAYYGLVCGASVGVNLAIIKCSLPGKGFINHSTWYNENGNLWLYGVFSKWTDHA